MKDFFKYLTPGDEDKKWGIYLNVAGKSNVPPSTTYPSREHPNGYYFTWKKGRILEEYQLVYISSGSGELATTASYFKVHAGTILLIRPGEHHSYRPNIDSGWVENYIGFNGPLVKHFYKQATFLHENPLFHCHNQSLFIDSYYKLFELIQEEKPGFQQIASGMILELLGKMVAHHKQGDFSGKSIEQVIQKTRLYIRENIENNIDFHQLALHHHISYNHFRKMFKKYTGMAPKQYLLELKLMRAKEMILTSDKPISQISENLHFESIHYFSRYFKKKMGCTPSSIRK